MDSYRHSVRLDESRCIGCTTCLRHCPTEAIRIRAGRAVINPRRCIDCGACIRECPQKAKKATCGKIEQLSGYKWKIALPAPTLYGQFEGLEDVDYVLQGLLDIGFDDVYEVAGAAELVSAYTRLYLKTEGIKKPVISSACPVIVRLIALRFPSLRDNILPLLPPMEVAATLARERAKRLHPELSDGDICVCFISPCPAKVSYVTNGFGEYRSRVNLVVSISDIYFMLLDVMRRDKTPVVSSDSGSIGIGWAASGGEATAILGEKYLAADGIDNVIHVLDQIENGVMPQLEFIELGGCVGGCVGGAMAVENPYVARARLTALRRYLPVSQNFIPEGEYIPERFFFEELPTYQPIARLSDNFAESLRMMSEIQRLRSTLPGVDCGCCGAPSCRAFAEDVVKGECPVESCILLSK